MRLVYFTSRFINSFILFGRSLVSLSKNLFVLLLFQIFSTEDVWKDQKEQGENP